MLKAENIFNYIDESDCAKLLSGIENLVLKRRELISRCKKMGDNLQSNYYKPVCVALAGIPGSGKTTLAEAIVKKLQKSPLCVSAITVSLDGFHLTRLELDMFPEGTVYKKLAFERRGAPFTFNPRKYYEKMLELSTKGRVQFPSFDHRKKDPVEDDISIVGCGAEQPGTNCIEVLIVEGLYTLFLGEEQDYNWEGLDDPDPGKDWELKRRATFVPNTTADDRSYWGKAVKTYDLKVFLNANRDVCTERLVRRHMKVWGIPRGLALVRASGSDFDNGIIVGRCMRNADLILNSIEAPQTCSHL